MRGAGTAARRWLHREVDGQRFGLLDVILFEVLLGMREDRDFRTVREELLKFEIFMTGGRRVTIEIAEGFHKPRRKGITVRRCDRLLDRNFLHSGRPCLAA